MNALVVVGTRVRVTPDGKAWTLKGTLGWKFWARYLEVYDNARILVRAESVSQAPAGWSELTGESIQIAPLPDFHSVSELIRGYRTIARNVRVELQRGDALHLRVPAIACDVLERNIAPGHPYGVEVVGDPYDVYSRGSIRHPLRPLMRWWSTRRLRRQCAGACAAAYVTERHLQLRYPPSASAHATSFSSIQLADDAFAPAPKSFSASNRRRLIIVGTWEALYKAPDVLIDAVAREVAGGLDLELEIAGGGPYVDELRGRAASAGIAERTVFSGVQPDPAAVRSRLDAADLFVLPSRQEGLPRAMIEAMARGLPAIGSTVGGFPELLAQSDMVPPDDAGALAAKIREVLGDTSRMSAMAERNWIRARDYREERLRRRRNAFYGHVRQATRSWIERTKDL